MNNQIIDRTLASRVLAVVDAGLVHGLGSPEPGKMCVEAAVCYAMGLPHGDSPSCVATALRSLKIRLNDVRWSSDSARAAGLRRLAIAQLGSAGQLDESAFAQRCVTLAIRTCVPNALRAAASLFKNSSPHKKKLLAAADLCERDPTRDNVISAKHISRAADAAAYAAAAYAADAAADAAYAAADAAAYAADAAAYAADAAAYAADAAYAAADAAAYAADAAAAYAAADAAARDKQLAAFAEGVVQILIEMKAPGCEFLYLTEVAA